MAKEVENEGHGRLQYDNHDGEGKKSQNRKSLRGGISESISAIEKNRLSWSWDNFLLNNQPRN